MRLERVAEARQTGAIVPAFARPCLFRVLCVFGVLIALLGIPTTSAADDEGADEPLRLRKVTFQGHQTYSARTLRSVLQLQPRSWYALWRERPAISDTTLAADIRAVERYYEARGYYGTRARYRLDTAEDSKLTNLVIEIEETPPVLIRDVQIVEDTETLASEKRKPLPPLPVRLDQPFIEEEYQAGEPILRQYYLEHSFARSTVRRSATVDTHARNARIIYEIERGPECVFGTTRVEGEENVARRIIEREIQIEPGTRFHPQAIADARNRLLGLDLFRVVQITAAETEGPREVVDLNVRVEEKPPRSIMIGLGYGTEDQVRARFAWSNRNFLGDGRQLSFQTRISAILASGTLLFVQPHLFSPKNRGIVEASVTQLLEDSYSVNTTRVRPRFERRLHRTLLASVAYRVEQVFTSSVDEATRSAIGGLRGDGLITGPALRLTYDSVDDELDPTRGGILVVGADQYGKWWPGHFGYYLLSVDGRRFFRLPWRVVFATRAQLATMEALDGTDGIPIHDRLYSGGDRSVRGYGRRRLGPLSSSDRPLGGLSRFEASAELRRPVWSALGAAVFVDAGQVSLRAYDFDASEIEFAAGVGASYSTPVGPLRLDVAFPLDPPRGDPSWRVHFSVGQYF